MISYFLKSQLIYNWEQKIWFNCNITDIYCAILTQYNLITWHMIILHGNTANLYALQKLQHIVTPFVIYPIHLPVIIYWQWDVLLLASSGIMWFFTFIFYHPMYLHYNNKFVYGKIWGVIEKKYRIQCNCFR